MYIVATIKNYGTDWVVLRRKSALRHHCLVAPLLVVVGFVCEILRGSIDDFRFALGNSL